MALKAYERLSYLNENDNGVFKQPMRIKWYFKEHAVADETHSGASFEGNEDDKFVKKLSTLL